MWIPIFRIPTPTLGHFLNPRESYLMLTMTLITWIVERWKKKGKREMQKEKKKEKKKRSIGINLFCSPSLF